MINPDIDRNLFFIWRGLLAWIFLACAVMVFTACVGATGIRAAEVTGVDLDVGSDVILLAERSIIPVCVLIGLIVLGILGRNVSFTWRGHIETEKGQCIKEEP
jgi:hypothetical protein